MTNVCFILGIMPRSGTNFLENQLILHEKCIAPGPIWEDFFVSTTPFFEKLKSRLALRWDKYWFRNTEINYLHKFGLTIGNSLKNLLLEQSNNSDASYLITKTPSVRGLDNFELYFPDTKLLIIIRDGRDVAESGIKSFRWDFVKSLYDWKINANKIASFMKNSPNSALLIRFEDLCIKPEQTMNKVIEYLELDETNYPYKKLKNSLVSGSSTLKAEKGRIHWKATKKKENFQPVARYKSWSPWKKYLSTIIAGNELEIFGYEISSNITMLMKVQAYMFLAAWPFLVIPRTLYFAIKEKTFVLKTH